MKTFYLILSSAVIGSTLVFKPADIFRDLNVTQKEVKMEILKGLDQENYEFPVNKLAKALSPESRAIAVRALAVFAKGYINSRDFHADYLGNKEVSSYQDLSASGENLAAEYTSAEISSVQTQIELSRQGIEYLKKALNSPYLGAAEKAELKKQIAEAEEELVLFEEEHKEYQLELEKEAQEKRAKSYKQLKQDLEEEKAQQQLLEKLQKEEEEKTASKIREQLKARLTKFLAQTEDMDFDAVLVPAKKGIYKFADPRLEAKDKQWKLYFRAGEAPVAAARAFAQEWLNEL